MMEFLLSLVQQKIFVGTFLAMLLETVFPPIPSEIVLPLAGYLISQKHLEIFGLLYGTFFATIGTTVGALIYYYLSLTLGRKFVEKYGKYFLIDKKKLKAAENWFKKYGNKAVLFGRMAPGIRELVSIPAGLLKMDLTEYTFYTFLGSFAWSFFLITLGYIFGEATLPEIQKFSNLIFVVITISIISYIIFRYLVKKKS